MKISKVLKVAAVILLLQGIFVIAVVIFGDLYSNNPAIPVGLVGPMFAVIGLAEIATSIGLWMSKKIAVCSTLIISIIGLLVNLSNAISAQGKDLWGSFFIIFFAVVIYLSISCIIKDRQQNKVS